MPRAKVGWHPLEGEGVSPMILSRVFFVCAIGLTIGISAASRADLILPDLPPESNALHLRTGKVVLEPAQSLHRLDPAAPGATIEEKGHFVIQLDGPLTPAREAALTQTGVTLGQYLPMYAYIIELPAGFNTPAQLTGLDFVRWVGAYEASWKLDPDIGMMAHTAPDRVALAEQDRLRLVVSLFEGADMNAALDQINALPAVVINTADDHAFGGAIELDMPAFAYQALADVKEVHYVAEVGDFLFRNDTNKWICQTNINGSTTVWDNGIRGEGQIGGLIDGAVRQDHCSFADPGGNPIGPAHRKFEAYVGAAGSNGHGTHVAGTFVGNEQPISGGTTYRGMAYMAKLVANRTSVSTSNVNTLLTQDHNLGARVHSNSWGWDGSQTYIQAARDIDLFSRTNEESLVLVAVTNQNAVVYQPENAKNCIGVALLNDAPSESQCFAAGRATTNDGRRKPELLAPGCSTWSSNSGTTCGFTNSGYSGTSMATPVISGCGLLTRQYFMNGYYPTGAAVGGNAFTPSAALVKAILMNSGRDVTGIAGFPSNNEGWGRVTLDDALYFAGDARKLIVLDDIRNNVGLTTGQSKAYNVNVTAGMSLKVSLVWTEPAAAVNANPAYINDLNLTVAGPGGTYLGNNFASGQSATGGSADFRNNVEQVYLLTPAAGTYTITVNALAVNAAGSPQGFAAVVTGNVIPTPQQPDCDQSGGFDLALDTACFVDVLLGINTNPASQAVVDMDGNTFNNGQDIQQWIDCVVNNNCN